MSEFDLDTVVSPASFKENYKKVLQELDALARGVFDESEAKSVAALCLIAQAGLIKILSSAEQTARGLKRDIDFAKSDAYYKLREVKDPAGKKMAETAVKELVPRDDDVNRLSQEQNLAEKEARELANLLNILRDAHVTFRMIDKKG